MVSRIGVAKRKRGRGRKKRRAAKSSRRSRDLPSGGTRGIEEGGEFCLKKEKARFSHEPRVGKGREAGM